MIRKTNIQSLFLVSFFASAAWAQSPNDVIINEVLLGSSSGQKDAVELLVTKSGGVDMRGWTLSDGSSPTGEGRLKLPNDAFLQNVPQYTRVVLVSNKGATFPYPAEDTDASTDSLLVLFADSATVDFSLTQTGSFDFTGTDNAVLISGPDSASGTVIDIVSWGGDISGWPSGQWSNNLSLGANKVAYFTNQTSGGLVNDNGSDGWLQSALEADHTLGRVNPGQFLEGKPIRLGAVTYFPLTPTASQSDTVEIVIGHTHSLTSASVVYTTGATPDSVTMTNISDSTYRGIIPPKNPGDVVSFLVRVIDSENNMAMSASYQYSVQTPLRFGTLRNYPTIPDPTQPVTIRAVVVSETTPTVKLLRTVNSVLDSISMNAIDDSTYETSSPIPPQSTGTTVTYQVKVVIGTYVALSNTVSYTVTDTFHIVDIPTIQANPYQYTGQTVSVAGIAVFGDGKLSTTQRKFYVVQSAGNGTRGIQIFSFTPATSNLVQRGDSVIVRGYVKEFSNITEVTDTTVVPLTVSVVATNQALPAQKLIGSFGQISDVSREGEWIKTKGTVTEVFTFTSGSSNVTINDGTSSIVVRIESAAGIVASQTFTTNQNYLISGIVGYFSPSTQIALGYASDVSPDTAGAVTSAKAGIKVSPHPFNPRTGEVIQYALRYGPNSRVIVRLYDVSGRLISVLADEIRALGRDESKDELKNYRKWDGRTRETSEVVPIGTYILSVEVTDRQTGKSSTKSAPVVVGTKLK